MSAPVMVCFENVGVVPYPVDRDPANRGAGPGQVLGLLGPRLDGIARRLGVRPLSDFHPFYYADPRPYPSCLDEFPSKFLSGFLSDFRSDSRRQEDDRREVREAIDRLLASQQPWHPVTEGRRTTKALLSYLGQLDRSTVAAQHPALMRGGTLEPVLAALRLLNQVLSSDDSRFHLKDWPRR